jgi:hypothetical protein
MTQTCATALLKLALGTRKLALRKDDSNHPALLHAIFLNCARLVVIRPARKLVLQVLQTAGWG